IALMIAISMIMMPAQTNGLNQLPPELYPHGTAIMNTLQQVSGAIGTAVGISILSSGSRKFLETVSDRMDPLNQVLAFTNGVQHSFIFAVIVAIVGLVISFFIKRVKLKEEAN
ncbi:MFS transporter, partial [Priestia megaterium]